MLDAQRQGIKIAAKSNVDQHIEVKSVVVPYSVAKRVFGKEIAETHIVVQLAISNSSPSMAFVLHNAFIDFSKVGNEPSAGLFGLFGGEPALSQGRNGSATSRISSVESRVARGQLLDAQQTTGRNITMRVLTTLGSIAAGYSFSFGEKGIAKGIAAFNGNVVPGVAYAWPDLTVAQINRISDFGYQTNKLIPKEGGEIVVCFFPIADFLTPGFQQIFKKAPAALFTPLQMIKDKSIKSLVYKNLKLETLDVEAIETILPCFQLLTAAAKVKSEPPADPANEKQDKPRRPVSDPAITFAAQELKGAVMDDCRTTFKSNIKALTQLLYLQNLSFDNLLVEVDGIMTVDVRQVPARIAGVTFEGADNTPQLWAAPGTVKGKIEGEYLANGTLKILETAALGIEDVTVDTANATDRLLPFSFKVTKAIPSGSKLTFVVDRKFDANQTTTSTVSSMKFEYVVGYVLTGPVVTKVAQEDATVTLTGANLFNTTETPLKLSLTNSRDSKKVVDIKPKDGATATSLTFDLPASLDAGCWIIKLATGTMQAPAIDKLAAKLPASKLSTAKREGTVLNVEGEGFLDTAACGAPLRFKARLASGDLIELKPKSETTVKKAAFDIPDELKKVKWQLELWQGDKEQKPSLTVEAPTAP